MNCRDLVEVLARSGIQAADRPVTASSLGLPDAARVRLLAELGGLLRIYCAETPGGLPTASRLRSNLEGTGYNTLALVTTKGEEFLAVYVAVGGEEAHKTLSATEVAGLLKNAGLAGEVDAASASDRILELLTFEEAPKAYNNRGLFSDDYLEHRAPEGAEWAETVSVAYESFRELYESKKNDLLGLDEANTEMEFVEPALTLLGFHSIKRAKTKTGAIPDYALFGSAEDKNAASKVTKNSEAFYARTLAVVEGKYWGRNLDVYTKKEDQRETEKQTSSPEMQVVRYLRETEISWGILTNGAEWRLYHGDSVGKANKYYSVNFERALATEEDFKRFYLFFRREAFVPKGPESKSFLDRVLEGSEQYAIRVGNNLKDVIFTRVFPDLAKGFLEYHTEELSQPVDEQTLIKIYRGTLALLYRLLFLLYAEARDLLPTGDRLGYGARGINAIKADVAKHRDEGYTYTDGYVLWQSLVDLFRVVDEGNQALKVPPYNGGLFKDDGNHELLGTHRISDHHLAPALDALARQKDEDSENRFVDYGFVGVRELGSVYEGLLEFSLKIANEDLVIIKKKGREIFVPRREYKKKAKPFSEVKKVELYLVNDKLERKATGSYYTPRYIVDYIVENTLGSLVEERREALEKKLEEVRRTDDYLRQSRKSEEYRAERRREAGALETLLGVKVVDPAMGSGHFLVAAVDYLTDEFSRLISELEAEPIIEQLARLREEIEESLERYGTEAGEEQLSDANLLKRMILKRCIYGVDQNEMAVELAKLSLWLDAFTVGAPLSFLDHHLKHGNSLIGSSVRDVRRELEGSGALSGTAFEVLLSGAEFMHKLEENPDATIAQVKESASLYAAADNILDPMRQVMDVWTSRFFDNSSAETVLRDELSSNNFADLARGDLSSFSSRGQDVFQKAASLRKAKTLFHWELEFPEVFYEGPHERENPGFDAVVGNPPYFSISGLSSSDKLYLKSAYSEIYAGNSDILYYFVGRGVEELRRQGILGFILARYYTEARFAEGLRDYILSKSQLKKLVDFQNFEVFPTANVLTNILVLSRADVPGRYEGYVLRIKDDNQPLEAVEKALPSESEELFTSFRFDSVSLSGAPWSFSDTVAQAIKDRMLSGTWQLDCFFEAVKTMETGMNQVFVVDEQTARFHRLEESLLKPLAKTGNVRRYYVEDLRKYVLWTEVDDISAFPNTMKYLTPYRDALAARYDIRAKGADWWRISNPRNADLFSSEQPRILTPFMSTSNKFHLDSEKHYNDGGDLRGIFAREDNPFDMYFVLALLNSKAGEFFHKNTAKLKRGGYYEYYSKPLSRFPIPCIHFTTPQSGRSASARKLVALHEAGDFERLRNMVQGADGREGALGHDLLSYLANPMCRFNR